MKNSFLVIYTPKSRFGGSSGVQKELRTVLSDLSLIESLEYETISAIYEIVRAVPVETKYREEKEVVRHRPYLEIDGREFQSGQQPISDDLHDFIERLSTRR